MKGQSAEGGSINTIMHGGRLPTHASTQYDIAESDEGEEGGEWWGEERVQEGVGGEEGRKGG